MRKLKKMTIVSTIIFLSFASCSGKRVGAICEDGWRSTATGSGACSHHGGVDHWVYENDK